MNEHKLNNIIKNFRDGNRREASTAITRLTKVELFHLLVHDHRLESGFFGYPKERLAFHDFVGRALSGWPE